MATILKRPPQHFKDVAAAQNAIQFDFALAENNIDVEVTSFIENGQRMMQLRCTNGKEAEFKRLCEKYHPNDISDDGI